MEADEYKFRPTPESITIVNDTCLLELMGAVESRRHSGNPSRKYLETKNPGGRKGIWEEIPGTANYRMIGTYFKHLLLEDPT